MDTSLLVFILAIANHAQGNIFEYKCSCVFHCSGGRTLLVIRYAKWRLVIVEDCCLLDVCPIICQVFPLFWRNVLSPLLVLCLPMKSGPLKGYYYLNSVSPDFFSLLVFHLEVLFLPVVLLLGNGPLKGQFLCSFLLTLICMLRAFNLALPVPLCVLVFQCLT